MIKSYYINGDYEMLIDGELILGLDISTKNTGWSIIKHNDKEIVMINPVITRTRGEVNSEEGCLSVPHLFGTFKRAQKVWCEYTDENGNRKEIAEGGLCSRIIQHKLEHMDGWCEVFSLVK